MKRFFLDDSGLETIEYAIIAGLITSGLVALIIAIGNWVRGQFRGLLHDVTSGTATPVRGA